MRSSKLQGFTAKFGQMLFTGFYWLILFLSCESLTEVYSLSRVNPLLLGKINKPETGNFGANLITIINVMWPFPNYAR